MEKIDSLLNYCNENGMFNGSIAIAKNDTVIFKKSYGLTEKESSKKINSETLFYLASVSKQFTAMSIMILQEKGLLEYEEPVVKYLPELKSLGSKVTIRQLLNHTSGISDRLYYKLKKPNNQEVIEALKTLKPAEFGNSIQNFRYSNSGFILLDSIIEKIS
jgi:CubicO group peptidase (beta-lactamase class C family)